MFSQHYLGFYIEIPSYNLYHITISTIFLNKIFPCLILFHECRQTVIDSDLVLYNITQLLVTFTLATRSRGLVHFHAVI